MSARLQKFIALSLGDKLLLMQAWGLLGWYRAAVLLVPFKRLTARFRHHSRPQTPGALNAQQREQALQIGYLVAVAANYTPWQSLCLVQVLTTRRLLARRGIPGQFFLGVQKGEISEEAPNGLAAHAWLQCADTVVNGGAGHEQYTVTSAFSWASRNG